MANNPRKFININLYDAEKYAQGKTFKIAKYVPVDDKTNEEIEKIIKDVKDAQREKNRLFRATKQPRKRGPPQRIFYERGYDSAAISKDIPIHFDNGTGNTFVLFGASKSGKTTLMMKIYNDYWKNYCAPKRTLTTLFAMNPQIKLYDSAQFIIKCDVFDTDSANYIDWQRKTNKLNNNKFTFLNMFDDIIDVRHKSIINNLILTYRNSNMSAIICLQYVNLLSKAARSNINNVFLMHMNTDESIEVAIKAYLSALLHKIGIAAESGIQWYRDHTRDHNFIYINPTQGCAWVSLTRMTYQL